MKLLFDQNLSFKLCQMLSGFFSESAQVFEIGLDKADDLTIWNYARENGFTIVSKDADFAEMSALYGPPPKLIWLRCGNQPTPAIAMRLSAHVEELQKFELDATATFELY